MVWLGGSVVKRRRGQFLISFVGAPGGKNKVGGLTDSCSQLL